MKKKGIRHCWVHTFWIVIAVPHRLEGVWKHLPPSARALPFARARNQHRWGYGQGQEGHGQGVFKHLLGKMVFLSLWTWTWTWTQKGFKHEVERFFKSCVSIPLALKKFELSNKVLLSISIKKVKFQTFSESSLQIKENEVRHPSKKNESLGILHFIWKVVCTFRMGKVCGSAFRRCGTAWRRNHKLFRLKKL